MSDVSTARRPYRGKRLSDLAILLVAAVPALALGSLAALAVRLTSKGPVLFRQERVSAATANRSRC
jgi:lipopolysaccharide/colanic/teichoic acid biosynthesis glycosyltransferase